MIFTAEFQNLMTRMNISQTDVEFATTIWSAAERVCHGKPSQVPALFQATNQDTTKEDISFTKSELMFLKTVLVRDLQVLQDILKEDKHYAANYWKVCDKNDPETEGFFKSFNEIKDSQRKAKAMLNKLSSIQRKLKKQLSA